jgi:hypothetical protein
MKRALIFAVALMFMALPLLAANHYDEGVTVYEDNFEVACSGQVAVLADSGGVWYTKAIKITDCNYYPAYFKAYMGANDSAKVVVQYSVDRENWTAGSQASGVVMTTILTTVQRDTLDTVEGVKDLEFPLGAWVRFQISNAGSDPMPSTAVLYWQAVFTKTIEARTMGSGRVKNKL